MRNGRVASLQGRPASGNRPRAWSRHGPVRMNVLYHPGRARQGGTPRIILKPTRWGGIMGDTFDVIMAACAVTQPAERDFGALVHRVQDKAVRASQTGGIGEGAAG